MKFRSTLRALGGFVTDLVFPVYCLFCGKHGTYFCADCVEKMPIAPDVRCIVCNSRAPFGKTHPACAGKNKVDGIVSALPYSNPKVKKIVEAFKYSFVSDLAQPLASIIVKQINALDLKNFFSDFLIVPVPLHPQRLSWRTFNQSELLATNLGKALGMKVDPSFAQRIRFTKPQVNLNVEQRKSNIAGAFTVRPFEHSKILLVDDVVTTGTTLNELAKMLKKTKDCEVWAATVAFD